MFASDSEDAMRKHLEAGIRWHALKAALMVVALIVFALGALLFVAHEVKAMMSEGPYLSGQLLVCLAFIAYVGYAVSKLVKSGTLAQFSRPTETALYRSVLSDGAEITHLGKVNRHSKTSISHIVRMRTRVSGPYELELPTAAQRDDFFAWLLTRAPHAQPYA